MVAARGVDGSFVHYRRGREQHERHILDVTIAPARVPREVAEEAVAIARRGARRSSTSSACCASSSSSTRDGKLMINELAPRPHNSGHFTFDACVTSQFEQQLRAVCGLPLGSTEQMRPAAMANLLGDLWANGEPDWAAACAITEREAAPVREDGAAAGPENGARDGTVFERGGSAGHGESGEGGVGPWAQLIRSGGRLPGPSAS